MYAYMYIHIWRQLEEAAHHLKKINIYTYTCNIYIYTHVIFTYTGPGAVNIVYKYTYKGQAVRLTVREQYV